MFDTMLRVDYHLYRKWILRMSRFRAERIPWRNYRIRKLLRFFIELNHIFFSFFHFHCQQGMWVKILLILWDIIHVDYQFQNQILFKLFTFVCFSRKHFNKNIRSSKRHLLNSLTFSLNGMETVRFFVSLIFLFEETCWNPLPFFCTRIAMKINSIWFEENHLYEKIISWRCCD